MNKKGNKGVATEKSVRRLKITLIIALVLCVGTLTAVVAELSLYNMEHATVMYKKVINYAIMTFGYLAVAYTIIYTIIHYYEKYLGKYIDTDKLTNGINYEKFLREAQARVADPGETNYAVFYGDIQNFKYINDTFGYDIGDKLLMYISQKIREAVGDKDGLYARISADNYTALIPYKDKNDFVESIYSIIDDICWFEPIQRENYKPEIYVGIYCTGDDSNTLTISEMIDRANMAQKSIKGSTEYHIAFYTEEIRERVIAEKELERRMESALSNGEFKAFFQPKYQVSTGEIVGAEALVRWDSPETGFMSPGKFIPLFEQNGFIINLDQYIFETVCKNIREWIDEGVKVVPISVNVSRLQFYRIDFVKHYTKIKEKYNIPDGLLELEFTESIVFENLAILRKIVTSLKSAGFTCSIDDFGSGYSSLNILKNLPMDTLKLDKLFFDDSENLTRDKALISSVINMSRALEMKTVAEGIENWAQVAFLKEIGCDIIQGYVYSEPIPHARFTNLLEGNRRKEIPTELRKSRGISVSDSDKDAVAKYVALIGMLDGMLIEVDYDTGNYEFINVSDKRFGEDASLKGENFDEVLSGIVDKFVHPDDVKSVLGRCSTVSVMSTFYQNEPKIITELRIKLKKSKDYEWAKMTISRLDPNPDHNDFRALIYVEMMNAVGSEENNQKAAEETIKLAMSNVCSFIYEFDLNVNNFIQIYCDDDLKDQPLRGEISWLRECFIPKRIIKDDVEKVQNFFNPEYIKEQLKDSSSGPLTIKTTVKFKKGDIPCYLSFVKMKYKDIAEDDCKYVLLCNVE